MIEIDANNCDRCGTCVGVCSSDAIFIEIDSLSIDNERCVLCFDCILVCPTGALMEGA